MNDDPRSHGLWEVSAPAAPATPPLASDVTADVAVVGAGFTGLSAALHLALGGASAVVIEAVDIGFGGSGRNVGLVNAGMWVMPSALHAGLGRTCGPSLLRQLSDAPALVFELIERHRIDCQPVHTGTLHCAANAKGFAQLKERARQWQELGAAVRMLDAEETATKVGTTAYLGSLLDLRAGTIQPLAYARGLAAAAIAAGARVHTGSPVVAVEDLGWGWRVRVAAGGSVRAKWVIVATNAYTGRHGVWSQLAEELVRLPYFNLATAPLPEKLARSILPERQGAWDTRRVLSSFRFDRAGRLIFGGVGALRGLGRSIHPAWGRRALANLFPRLKGVDFEHEWYGSIGMTANALPRFHELGRNTVSFSGYNGRGIAPGTTFGRDLARLVLGQVSASALSLPATPVAPASLKPAKEAFYEIGAQAAHVVGARF
jgi:glycine/D-amino acid oxidase-like deaminating enzyme